MEERLTRVLVVDDEPFVRKTLVRALRDWDVVMAESGQQAVELLGRDWRFDAVLCDLMMPGVTGMDVYDRATAEVPALREAFIFLTGGAFTDRARQFIEATACPVLEKPFNFRELQEIVRELIERRV